MHTREKLISARVSMLALADQFQNVSRAGAHARVRVARSGRAAGTAPTTTTTPRIAWRSSRCG